MVRLSVAALFLGALIVNRPAAAGSTGSLTSIEVAAIVFSWHAALVLGANALLCGVKRQVLPHCTARHLPVLHGLKWLASRLRDWWRRNRLRLGLLPPRPRASRLQQLEGVIARTASWKLHLSLLVICVLPGGPVAALVALSQRGDWSLTYRAIALGLYGWLSFMAYYLVIGLALSAIKPPTTVTLGLLTLVVVPLALELLGLMLRASWHRWQRQLSAFLSVVAPTPPSN